MNKKILEMSIKELKEAILKELQVVTKNAELRMKNIENWSTVRLRVEEEKTLVFLPVFEIWVSYKTKAQIQKTLDKTRSMSIDYKNMSNGIQSTSK